MANRSQKRKNVDVAPEEGELSRTKKSNVVAEEEKGSQAVEPAGNANLPRPNLNAAGPQPVELDAKLQQASSSAGTPPVQAEQLANLLLIPDSNAAVTPVVQPDQDANNRGHLPDLQVILIPGGVSPVPRILNFVQNLRKAEIKDKVLAVPGGAYLGGRRHMRFLGGKMLIRQCYIELKDQMMNLTEEQLHADVDADDFLVLGNPGIGKSMFAYYMLYELMRLKKTIVWQYSVESQEAVLITPTSISFVTDLVPLRDYVEEASSWYIVDGQPPKQVMAITLLITSPDNRIWKDFAKEDPEIRYMPIWSKAEIDMVKPRGMAFAKVKSCFKELDVSVIDEQYRIWGGIPRFVFQKALKAGENTLKQAINDMQVENLHNYIGVTEGRDARHKVMHMIVTIDCAEDKRYLDYVMDFASDYAREEVLKRSLNLNHAKVKEFITSASGESKAAVFRGMLFEAYGHTFLCSRTEFMVRKLDEIAPNVHKPFLVNFGKGAPMKVKEFENVPTIKDPKYWIDYFKPASKNYKSIDSLVFPISLFQLTVAREHPVKSAGLMEVVEEMLTRRTRAPSPEKKNFRLYFVVPNEKFATFERQKYKGKEPTFPGGVCVDQYVLQVDMDSSFFGKPMEEPTVQPTTPDTSK